MECDGCGLYAPENESTVCLVAGGSFNGPGAVIGCSCDKVEIKFHNTEARLRFECCCVDCSDAMIIQEEAGGPKASLTTDGWYFDNRFTVVRGYDNITFFKLSNEDPATRMVTTCCCSIL